MLVTGGASGFGAEIITSFVRQGSRVVCLDFNAESGARIAAETGALFIPCDLRDIGALRAVIVKVPGPPGAVQE